MHDPAYEHLRTPLPRTSVNKGERTKGQGGNRPPCMGRFGRTKKGPDPLEEPRPLALWLFQPHPGFA
jgi:hypothetical protein